MATTRRDPYNLRRRNMVGATLSDDEHAMLVAITQATGCNFSTWLRLKIRQDHAGLPQDQQGKAP
jgi:hypothetical protein